MKIFRGTDIYLTAYLRSLGFLLLSYDRSPENQRYYYTFEETPELLTRVDDYRYGDAVVHPRILRDNVRDIKNMVTSGKRVGGEF